MPMKLPTRSVRIKSPASRPRPSSSRRSSASTNASSTAAAAADRPRPRYASPPPLVHRRSMSHEAHDRRPLPGSSQRTSRRDAYEAAAAPRRRSTHRSSLSPSSARSRPGQARRDSGSSQGSLDQGHRGSREEWWGGKGKARAASAAGPSSRTRLSAPSATSPPCRSGGSHPARPAAVAAAGGSPARDAHLPGTPAKYKPTNTHHGGDAHASTSHSAVDMSQWKFPDADERKNLLGRIPGVFSTYLGAEAITRNAEKAKEWADWLRDLGDTPEEIQLLSERATTARDTITQIQGTLAARPDLFEGESGARLRRQVEDAVGATDDTLGDMTTMLDGLSRSTGQEGSMWRGLSEYWNSYRYKSEYEEKVKAADEELQRHLATLSGLMINIYSRALTKGALPNMTPVMSPGTTQATPAIAVASPPPPIPVAAVSPAAPVPAVASPPPVAVVVPPPVDVVSPVESPPPAGTTAGYSAVSPQAAAQESDAVPTLNLPEPTASEVSAEISPTSSNVAMRGSAAPTPAQVLTPGAADDVPPIKPLGAEFVGAGTPPPDHRTPIPSLAAHAVPMESIDACRKPFVAITPAKVPIERTQFMPSPPPVNPSTGGAPLPKHSSIDAAATTAAASIAATAPYTATSIPVPPVVPVAAATATYPAAAAIPAPIPASTSIPAPATAPDGRRESTASQARAMEPEEALLDAAWEGDLDGVARALRHAPVSACDLRGLTPLHLACERDNLAVAILLLDRGADVHARANGGRMPLHLAARYASASTVEMLLERGRADPGADTADGRSPLHYAASAAADGDEDRREVLRVLRDWGADPTVQDRNEETPRDVAQKRNFWDAASTLRRAEKKWDEEHHQNWLQKHGLRT